MAKVTCDLPGCKNHIPGNGQEWTGDWQYTTITKDGATLRFCSEDHKEQSEMLRGTNVRSPDIPFYQTARGA